MKIGLLWDLDGTLLDTLEDLTDSVNYALGEYSLPSRTLREVRAFVGNGAGNLIRQAVDGRRDPEAVLAVFQAHYRAHCQVKTRPYPGILPVLESLAPHYPMAVVSNKPDAAVKALAAQYFPGLYARGERAGCPRKPAPDMVLGAMDALGVDRCIYIGDSEVDIATANNAGVPCLSVLWGFRDRELLTQAGGRHFCATPEDLPDSIQKLEELLIHGQ